MKVGDLAETQSGNIVVIVEVGPIPSGDFTKPSWYSIVFSTTGARRDGYPSFWLRPHRGDK